MFVITFFFNIKQLNNKAILKGITKLNVVFNKVSLSRIKGNKVADYDCARRKRHLL